MTRLAMKIFLLHGDNTTASYERLMKYVEHAKKRSWDIIHYADKSQNLAQLVRSDSLFDTDKLVIVDNFDLLTKKDLEWLKEESPKFTGNLVIHHNKLLPKTKINSVPKLEKAEEFVYPVLLWKMVDAFYPKNAKTFIQLMHQVLEKEAVELVFGLLAKQVRDLYWVLVDPINCPLPDWKISKMQAVVRKFSKEQLESIIEELSEIDIQSKTSDTELKDLLDLLAVKHLE
jgi:DNA polymerase III delta subunit